MCTTPRDSRRAFTLIELLVVVAIIALLISILLPSLHAARKQTRLTKCAAQLHDIGVGLMGYNSDFRRYPHQNTLGSAGAARSEREAGGFWGFSVHKELARHMGGLDLNADGTSYTRTHPEFYCPFAQPSQIDFADVVSGPDTPYGVPNAEEQYLHISYTYLGSLHEAANDPAKWEGVSSPIDEGLRGDILRKRHDYVRKDPDARYVLMADSVAAWFGGSPPAWRINHGEGWKSTITASGYRAPKVESANLLFGDGHVDLKRSKYFRELTELNNLTAARKNATLRFGAGPNSPYQGDAIWW
jgi:prepilin-type N-terminal cleavage/methylation domain-containing protein/prepilin-type processing-associated H-X9-DG protein